MSNTGVVLFLSLILAFFGPFHSLQLVLLFCSKYVLQKYQAENMVHTGLEYSLKNC